MKCIKAIKPTKKTEVGFLTRTTDSEAELKVKSGYWTYVAKSEWKLSRGTKSGTKSEPSQEQVETEQLKTKKKK